MHFKRSFALSSASMAVIAGAIGWAPFSQAHDAWAASRSTTASVPAATAPAVIDAARRTQVSRGTSRSTLAVTRTTSTTTTSFTAEEKVTKSATLPKGTKKVQKKGRLGEVVTRWQVITNASGAVLSRTELSRTITRKPVPAVVLVGTGKASGLTPAVGNTCKASYYDTGAVTASGTPFNPALMTAANKELPLNTWIKVTNVANHRTVKVLVNDRGPYVAGRCIDLTTAAMTKLGGLGSGVITVTWQVLGR